MVKGYVYSFKTPYMPWQRDRYGGRLSISFAICQTICHVRGKDMVKDYASSLKKPKCQGREIGMVNGYASSWHATTLYIL